MNLRYTLLITLLLVALVFVVATVLELASQHLFTEYHETARPHSTSDHWSGVVTAVVAVALALILIAPGAVWLVNEGVQRTYRSVWARDIAKSEHYLRQATELAGLGYCIWDSVADRCLYCSEVYARIHGTDPEDYMARASAIDAAPSFTHPEDCEAFRATIREVRRGETRKIEYRIITPDGEVRDVREIIKPNCDERGTVIQECTTIQDITEQKAQERALKDHAERYREIFDESPVSLWAEDWSDVKRMLDGLAARAPDDLSRYLAENPGELARAYDLIKTVDTSQETVRIYRAPSKQAMRGFEKSVHASPEELSGYRNALCSFLSGTYQHEYEAEETAYDKSTIIVRVRHAIPPKHRASWSRVLVTVEDITERRRAMVALEASEARKRAILDSAIDCIVSMDHEGNIVDFNPAAERVFGYEAPAVVGKNMADLIIPVGFREAHRRGLARFLKTGEATVIGRRTEITAMCSDGSEFPVELTVSGCEINGRPSFTGYLRDITDRKAAEAALVESRNALKERIVELEETKAQLETAHDEAQAANRAKSQFLAAMSHELRTPLNAILGFSELIKEEAFGPLGNSRYLEYVQDIHNSGQHLLDLINDVLDLSKIESGENELYDEPIDVAQLVGSAIRLVHQRAAKGQLELHVDLQDDLPQLWADRRKVTQILVNLLSNAIKFTKPTGRVTLKARFREGDGILFQVIDTGIGMATADLPKALTRFTQVDSDLNRKFEGTGLGLPLTKALAELHGGSLDLESEPGVGTTATVRFPKHRIVERAPCDTVARIASKLAN